MDGKLAKFNCVGRDSTQIQKFKIQCNFLFERKKVWNSKQVSLTKYALINLAQGPYEELLYSQIKTSYLIG